MKIGIDARLWNESGVGRYVRNLIKQLLILDSKNEYVLFVLPKDHENIKNKISRLQLPSAKADGGQANIKNKNNWRIIETNIRWHSLEEQINFLPILNREHLDLVHFPYFSVPIFYNKPFVITIHDLILDHFPTGRASTLPLPIYKIKQLGYKFVIKQAVRKAKKIIAVSNATKNEIVNHFKVNEDKVVVTYEGVDQKISNIKYQISNKLQIANLKLRDRSYFLYVGNAYPHKNLERLLEAFGSKFTDIDSDFHQNDTKLVMVGKEDYFYKRLKEKVKHMGLQESVIFLHEVKDDELTRLYKGAKALVMPSLMEGFGLPIVESMSNKCLVLCSDIPVFREICGNSAVYFNPLNIDDIKEKLGMICFNDLNHFNKNIEEAFKRSEMFCFEKMARETLKIYESTTSVSLE